ncbi:histone-like nucleoid-structuring protein Lsr2 [Microbacterium sp. bgisy203]|uniref:histone-like nucleoid-structuring protein Lsr2 n=1 Tax=Microbacterium sp. bgisy203 TaxID=3413799 RepID=UPI003D7114B3
MARRIVHQLVDDLDGTVLEVGSGETVLFSLDGTAYEIDLTDENAEALRAALAPYVAAGRSVSARPAGGGTRTGSAGGGGRKQKRAGQRDYAPVRAWAAENGYELSERGRVPASVLEAYDAAH